MDFFHIIHEIVRDYFIQHFNSAIKRDVQGTILERLPTAAVGLAQRTYTYQDVPQSLETTKRIG
eukprot:8986880-Ditylum_brightwellii.AAC.1